MADFTIAFGNFYGESCLNKMELRSREVAVEVLITLQSDETRKLRIPHSACSVVCRTSTTNHHWDLDASLEFVCCVADRFFFSFLLVALLIV